MTYETKWKQTIIKSFRLSPALLSMVETECRVQRTQFSKFARDRDRRARPPEARRKTSCRIEESFRLVRSLSLASRYFQVMPWRRITVPMAVLWRGEGGQPHIAPTGDLAGVLQALVTTTITMHHRADILGIPHATSCVPQAR